ncbi:superinfection immunity protein [Hymenobacter elongatus]|uniref:Superinfection immunity protein n=1 Tax=Hymenobacter elongatus TaxID=877208 RepID=A0A4Z0PP08_9BACT|nr:superinfection immunity protein [Hymenobacter elongatus]
MPLLLLGIPAVFLVFFIPSIIARHRSDFSTILLINVVAGWSIIGWVAALYLALRKNSTTLSSTASAGPSTFSVADEIAKLRDLREQGVLTPAEFERQKNNLIS